MCYCPVTLVEGSTDAHIAVTATDGSFREDCAIATPTASGALPIASCTVVGIDNSLSVGLAGISTETASPIPVQVAAAHNGAGDARMAIGGIAASAMAMGGAMVVLLVHM